MEKIIHYCWFGNKPLPKLAKKCIKSWKKFLPDYKIIEWNEKNFDVNITRFSKQAYDSQKWAFVSDVARIYALKEYGGIYFDTDMIITKDVSEIIKNEVFAGWESEYNVAVGVLGAKEKNNPLINRLWNFYKENDFSIDNMYSLSIPTLLTHILKSEYGLKSNHLNNQTLKDGVVIYARDYFYPISCDKTPNMFTNRTCMIHYYVGSWLTPSEKKRLKFQIIFGKNLGNFILNVLVKTKHVLKTIAKIILYPIILYKRKKEQNAAIEMAKNSFKEQLNMIDFKNYIAICNKNWLGTQNATKENFDNVILIDEITEDVVADFFANAIIEKGIELVVFSAFSRGWEKIVKKLKELNPNITIKVIWHGSPAMNVEDYDFEMFELIFRMLDNNDIDSIGLVKKSMYDFYKKKGYKVELVLNTVNLSNIEIKKNSIGKKIKIGLYASGNRWVKNFYNQLGAASLFNDAELDCIPINDRTLKMARNFDMTIKGLSAPLEREKLLERLSQNDINFYVTFSECAPIIPLESLELGVPCITSNNHHYWEGTELEKYLIVNENDNILKIYEKAKCCLENKDIIMDLYKNWKKEYDKKAKKSVNNFLKIKEKEM